MEKVNAKRISDAPMEVGGMPTVPQNNDPLTRDPIIDQKLGMVGKFFGYGEEKKGNIAGIAFVFAAIMLAVCAIGIIFSEDGDGRTFMIGLITPLFGLMTGAIGYVTGKRDTD